MNSSTSLELIPASNRDIRFIKYLLGENGLPYDDITYNLQHMFLAKTGSEIVGITGMEIYGRYGLLRSLVSVKKYRGAGYGKTITGKILKHAADSGVGTVYLLTSTAAGFFEKLGFKYIDRSSVPEPIATTGEFTQLCPESADCMMLDLTKQII